MKKFLIDQLSYIIFFYSQLLLLLLIVQLAAMNRNDTLDLGLLFYLLLLPSCFLIVFLVFRYMKLRPYYHLSKVEEEFYWLPEPTNYLLTSIQIHYENQYQEYRSRIEQLEAMQAQELTFIQQWVHQMKTPLSVMDLSLQKEKHNLDSALVLNFQEEIDRLENGLELALYQARLKNFTRDFQVEKLDLEKVVQEAINRLKSSFIRNDVFPEVNFPDSHIVYSDSKWLSFVLQQVITNAIKYSAGTKQTIKFQIKKNDRQLCLQITDPGVGIPKQDVPRVFDPFFTGENGRSFRESTGMGLNLAKQICEELGHTISIESQTRKGTTVTITFTSLTEK